MLDVLLMLLVVAPMIKNKVLQRYGWARKNRLPFAPALPPCPPRPGPGSAVGYNMTGSGVVVARTHSSTLPYKGPSYALGKTSLSNLCMRRRSIPLHRQPIARVEPDAVGLLYGGACAGGST